MPPTEMILQQLGQGQSHKGQGLSKVQGHIGSNVYGCGQCLVRCEGKEGLRQHVTQIHGPHYTHICYECGKLFKSYQGYKKHEKFVHRDGGESKKCPICGRNFPNDSSLKQHQLKHADSKPYTCDKCGRSYKYITSLQYHTCVPQWHSGISLCGATCDVSSVCVEQLVMCHQFVMHHQFLINAQTLWMSSVSNWWSVIISFFWTTFEKSYQFLLRVISFCWRLKLCHYSILCNLWCVISIWVEQFMIIILSFTFQLYSVQFWTEILRVQ